MQLAHEARKEAQLMRKARQPDDMAPPRWAYSHAVVAGDFIYTSGQVAWDKNHEWVSDDVREQGHQVFRNVRACLEAAGSSLDDVVHVRAYLKKKESYGVLDELTKEYFNEPYPTRMTTFDDFGDRNQIEICVVAYTGGKSSQTSSTPGAPMLRRDRDPA